ncbi:MAG: ABC transporter ATP-binding protein [Candidatus Magasanikbacteria bacterium]|nr:ABC transporter ATP-binding protein [Candidatus Magasanikbacteria bacterium]
MIECRNVAKIYRSGEEETYAVKNITFTIRDGEFVAIMGPSGSGKSTLMNLLGCLDTPSAGQYLLNGADISALDDNELSGIRMRQIGFVFQSFNLLPRASVLRNVTLPLIYAGIKRQEREQRAAEALTAAALPEKFWSYRPHQLSGGMMQRVAIARALVNNPALILADEPTGNLDTKTGAAVLATFQKLHTEQQRTIILITHEPYVGEHAERIIRLRDGEIIDDRPNNQRRIL